MCLWYPTDPMPTIQNIIMTTTYTPTMLVVIGITYDQRICLD